MKVVNPYASKTAPLCCHDLCFGQMCCLDEPALYSWVQLQGCGYVDGTAVSMDALKIGLEAAMEKLRAIRIPEEMCIS